MLVVSMLRQIRGYVEFEMNGCFINRFINCCAAEGVSVWGIRKSGECFFGSAYAQDYKTVSELAGKCGIRTKPIKQKGFTFFLERYRKRIGVIIGLVVFALFICGTQNFIWSVDVSGNESVTSGQILSVMDDLGVRFGALKHQLDLKTLEAAALSRFEQFSWVAINCMGTKIHIEVREREKAPEILSEREPCNLVAIKDGTLTALNVRAGQKEVQKGDVVLKGDILVNGIMEDKKGNNLFRHAEGEIYAQTEISEVIRVPIAAGRPAAPYTEKSDSALIFFNFRLPLSLNKDNCGAGGLTVSKQLSVFGMQIPIGLMQTRRLVCGEEDGLIARKCAEAVARYKLKIFERQTLSEARILSKKLSFATENTDFVCKANYKCEENIAKQEKIYFSLQKNEKK